MEIIVCIKQVPGTTTVDIDEKTGVLLRGGASVKVNPYDLYAIEVALRLKEAHGGTVRVLTMGPARAEEVLREAYMMGADECVLLTDRAFAGADVLATSYALSEAIKRMGAFDLIVCGKQTTDGDTAQVGAELAEFLDLPHAANVTNITHVGSSFLRVGIDMADYVQVQDIPFPCLITVEKDIFIPRLPSYKRKLETADKEIRVLTLDELEDSDPLHYGLNGSPTHVERVFPPLSATEKIILDGADDKNAEFLYRKLKELKFLKGRK